MKSNSIIGRRVAKSNIQLNLGKQYSVSSFVDFLPTNSVPFQLKTTSNLIQPEIRHRIETLQQSVYRTQSNQSVLPWLKKF